MVDLGKVKLGRQLKALGIVSGILAGAASYTVLKNVLDLMYYIANNPVQKSPFSLSWKGYGFRLFPPSMGDVSC